MGLRHTPGLYGHMDIEASASPLATWELLPWAISLIKWRGAHVGGGGGGGHVHVHEDKESMDIENSMLVDN